MEAEFEGEAKPVDWSGLNERPASERLHRVGEIPMYSVDAMCRRSDALQQTVHADSAFVGLNPADASAYRLDQGDTAVLDQGGEKAELEVRITDAVPEGAALVRSASCATRVLGDSFGAINIAARAGSSGGSD
jgi:NADH-quinone oxidoreductase subunit G